MPQYFDQNLYVDEIDSSYEDFLDVYDDNDEDYFQDIHQADLSTEQTLSDLYFNYIQPTLRDALSQFISPIIITNLICIVLIQFFIPLLPFKSSRFNTEVLPRMIMISSGLYLLSTHYVDDRNQLMFLLAVIILSSFTVALMLAIANDRFSGSRYAVWFLWGQHLILITLHECFIFFFERVQWIKLRPNLMLMLMKSISYYHETRLLFKKKGKEMDGFFESFYDIISYHLHPSAILLGIWHPHNPHLKSLQQISDLKHFIRTSLCQSILSLIFSLFLLICSTCLIEYFLENILREYLEILIELFVYDPKSSSMTTIVFTLLKAYSVAIQFHYSHYFICFLGQSMFDLWDLRLTVTRPLDIEWPRSLVDVVVAWNIPMHQWLKKYVFQEFKKHFNIYWTILMTYFISSYLHGFNFQIWSVLLTLGLITQIEFKLRKLLSRILSACLDSRKCLVDYDDNQQEWCCVSGHRRTERNCRMVRLINLLFTTLALAHLAFLGATFDGRPDSSSIINVWTVWSNLNFYSHIILVMMFCLYSLLSLTL